ncbi:hypothetical protein MRX96_051868 [Rhipicephalus microplus]
MDAGSLSLAAVSDPYRTSKRIPHLLSGFGVIALDEDPGAAIIYRETPFDICPFTVTKLVVAIYCQARDFDFVLISAYAPPHRSMDPTLQAIEETLVKVRTPNVVVAGDFNAKHLVWGAKRR